MSLDRARIADILDKIVLSSLYIVAYMFPISKAAIEIFSTIAIVCYLAKKLIQRGSLPKTSLTIPVFIYLAICFASIFISSSFRISARTFWGKTIQDVAFFFVVADTLNSKRRLKIFVYLLLASVLLLTIDGIYQYFTHKDFIRNRPFYQIPRVHATFSSANDFGTYLAAILPFTLIYFFNKSDFKRWVRFSSIGLSIMVVICLLLTVSRGAWFAALSGMLFMSIWIRALGIFFLVIAIFIVLTQQFYFPFLKTRLENFFTFVDTSSVDRMKIWGAALRMFKFSPWVGLGLGTFMHNFNKFVVGYYKQDIVPYAHNCYLQIASELGIIGLISFLAILVVFFSFGIETIIYRKRTFSWYILLAGLASLLAYCLQMTVDTVFYSLDLGILFWMILGLGVAAMGNIRLEEARQ